MADVAVSLQAVVPAGLAETLTGSLSVANTYQTPNDGRVFIEVANGGGSPDTVTIITNKTIGGLAVADRTVLVAAGATKLIGPFPPDIYNDADGLLNWTHSFITSVTHRALHLG